MMKKTTSTEYSDNDALLPRIQSDEHEAVRETTHSPKPIKPQALEAQEEVARYRSLKAAEADSRTGQRRRMKALLTAKRYAQVEEDLRRKANLQAARQIGRSESEARERFKIQSSVLGTSKTTNGAKCATCWNRLVDRVSHSMRPVEDDDHQSLINGVDYEDLSM